MTRSKGWVVITGYPDAGQCKAELDKLCSNDYRMEFIQPDEKQTHTIYRGLDQMQSKLNEVQRTLEKLSAETGIPMDALMNTLNSQTFKK